MRFLHRALQTDSKAVAPVYSVGRWAAGIPQISSQLPSYSMHECEEEIFLDLSEKGTSSVKLLLSCVRV